MSTSGKRSGLLGVGIVVIIIGVLAGAGLWYSAAQRQSDAVRNLARAPIGCDTTLDFEATGDFYIFIESAGSFPDDITGDCAATGDYSTQGDDLPAVTLSLTAPDGSEVALDSRAGVSYDDAGFTGQSVRSFSVDAPGDHRLRVEAPGAPDAQFAAAVGRDPADGVGLVQLGAIVAAVAGLVVGLLLILVARRQRPGDEPVSADGAWAGQAAAWPTSPPGMPNVPPPPGTQPPVGPPTYSPPTHESPAQIPATPAAPPPAPGWAPQPPSPPTAPPTWGGAAQQPEGGERSPWAPPSPPSPPTSPPE